MLVGASTDVLRAVTADIADVVDRDERAVVAVLSALRAIRADPVLKGVPASRWLHAIVPVAMDSPAVCAIASELLGLRPDDAAGARWAVRGFLALLLWPYPTGTRVPRRRHSSPVSGRAELSHGPGTPRGQMKSDKARLPEVRVGILAQC